MRFEAKYQYFKKLAQTLGNFINIPKSLARRQQRLNCYQLKGSVISKQPEVKKGTYVPNV